MKDTIASLEKHSSDLKTIRTSLGKAQEYEAAHYVLTAIDSIKSALSAIRDNAEQKHKESVAVMRVKRKSK